MSNISSIAQASYMQVQNRPVMDVSNPIKVEGAGSFHQMVNKQFDIAKQQFNSFANLTPTQIAARISAFKVEGSTNLSNLNSGLLSGSVSSLKGTLARQEEVTRKVLIGDADVSMIDLLTATTEAKNIVDAMTKLRTEIFANLDKVMNMNV